DPKLQAALVRAYNNWGIDYCRDSAGKVQFVAPVSMLDVDEAIREAKRLAKHPQVASLSLPDAGAQRRWSDAEFDPFWATLQDLDMAASFHGGGTQTRLFKD